MNMKNMKKSLVKSGKELFTFLLKTFGGLALLIGGCAGCNWYLDNQMVDQTAGLYRSVEGAYIPKGQKSADGILNINTDGTFEITMRDYSNNYTWAGSGEIRLSSFEFDFRENQYNAELKIVNEDPLKLELFVYDGYDKWEDTVWWTWFVNNPAERSRPPKPIAAFNPLDELVGAYSGTGYELGTAMYRAFFWIAGDGTWKARMYDRGTGALIMEEFGKTDFDTNGNASFVIVNPDIRVISTIQKEGSFITYKDSTGKSFTVGDRDKAIVFDNFTP